MDTYSCVSFEDEGGEDVDGGSFSDLQECASLVQRCVTSRVVRRFARGGMDMASPIPLAKCITQKVFSVPKLFEWTSGEPEELLEALAQGRVRARLDATMGLGKSTRLSPLIAERLGCRVLLVAHDVVVMRQSAAFMSKSGIGKVRANWTNKPGSRVCQMTFGDFWACTRSSGRGAFLSSFDVILFDEAFMSICDVYVAKACFAVWSAPHASLILCSATMKNRLGSQAGQGESRGSGVFDVMEETVGIVEAIDSKKLVGERLIDRSFVMVPRDGDVRLLQAHYENNGVDCRILDSASNVHDVEEVNEWLQGDAITPRVVVSHSCNGIGLNLRVAYAIVWPFRSAWAEVDSRWEEVVIPLSEQMVTQATSRTGRGMVPGSGGIIMSPDRTEHVDLYDEDLMEAFFRLFAAGIRPLKNAMWAPCYAKFPDGVTPTAAEAVLKVCLPPEVAITFFSADGGCYPEFTTALNCFSQPNSFVMPTQSEDKVDKSSWVLEACGGYYSPLGNGDVASLRVPVRATGDVQVIVHAIVAMSEGRFDIVRWRPQDEDVEGVLYDSGSDSEDQRTVVTMGPRRISHRPVKRLEEKRVSNVTSGRRFREDDSLEKRMGHFSFSDRVKESLREITAMLDNYETPDSPLEAETGDDPDTPVEVYGCVESPGGSTVCTLPARICVQMNEGKSLCPEDMLEVVRTSKGCAVDFAASRCFDALSGPWESVLRSLQSDSVIDLIRRKGEATPAFEIVDLLRKRFDNELTTVLSRSNLYKGRFAKIFPRSKPDIATVMTSIKAGKFKGIAQSEGYFLRVRLIKEMIDDVLLKAESKGFFLTGYITDAQRSRYVGANGMPSTTGRLAYPPPSYVSTIQSVPAINTKVIDRLRTRMRPLRGSDGGYSGF